jgi:hypothetical protein
MQWKRFMFRSGSSRDSSNFVLSKSMFIFSGVNDGYYSESYGPGFVEALKGDRMSLYSADLLRSDSLFYWLRAFFVIYKKIK